MKSKLKTFNFYKFKHNICILRIISVEIVYILYVYSGFHWVSIY